MWKYLYHRKNNNYPRGYEKIIKENSIFKIKAIIVDKSSNRNVKRYVILYQFGRIKYFIECSSKHS